MIYWPSKLAPLSVACNPAPRSLAGTPSLSGLQQNVASFAGVWMIAFEGVGITEAAQIKLWRAVQAQADGRINKLVVPVRDISGLRPGGNLYREATDFGDGAAFDDGATYEGDIDATVAIAARGATEITIDGPVSLLDAGQNFSIGERLYRIKSVGEISGTTVSVKIWPPLREAAIADTPLNFLRPVCTVRLATDNEMDLTLIAGKFAAPTVRFIEDLS